MPLPAEEARVSRRPVAGPVRVKIYGAGSIGNHLAHASRRLGWEVVVCDLDEAALVRMQWEIYPGRYGAWDATIQLFRSDDAPRGGFDLIGIGTPPEFHIPLALEALKEHPKALLIEKPLCPPSLDLAQELYERAQTSATKVFVGYDHVVGRAARKVEALLHVGSIGTIETIDVEFREHWGGIFKAHPWLRGPEESYLGFWQRGGGASGEHSHGVNFWQHLAHVVGGGRVIEVDAMVDYVTVGRACYDRVCFMTLRTASGLMGRVAQDVVTRHVRKRARIQGTEGAIEWINHYNSEGDAVIRLRPGQPDEVEVLPKARPDDFIEELQHLHGQWTADRRDSGIRLERGLDTMLVVAAAHRAEAEGARIQLDYGQGYTIQALRSRGETVSTGMEKARSGDEPQL